MDVKLISQDRDLLKLCREILAELPDGPWTVSAAKPEDSESGLRLWDFEPGMTVPRPSEWSPSSHLFLVHRSHLESFHARLGTTQANVLLKPVTHATLAACLGLAVSAHRERLTAASSLRADRDEILQCLIQTNLKLQEYDQDRTNFLARAVHDFRAPLTALSGYCGLLLGEPLGPLNENQKEVLQRMLHSAKRLSRMAAAMFELSVGRKVKKQPELQNGDIRECLDQALHEIAPFADDKQIEISAEVIPGDCQLYFDPGQIEQVLVNILDNACKFTPRAGSIEIRGYPFFWERRAVRPVMRPVLERRASEVQEPNAYRIDIRDSGAPIHSELLDRIFEEYTSYGGGRDRSGGGLGLAICRMIAAQHDGHIWAENTGSGPMFSFVLPTYRPEPTQADNTQGSDNSTYVEVG